MPQPTPPTNVYVERGDGEHLPLECVYVGVEDGIHVWLAVTPVTLGEHDSVCADSIPGYTKIVIQRQVEED